MNEVAAYSTMAMTVGLVVARPAVGPNLRLTPAVAAWLGVALLALLGVTRGAHVTYAASNLGAPFVAIGSLMILTEIADRVGLLTWAAGRLEAGVATTAGLFLRVFALGVATSTLLNNDAAILVLTPVVVAMTRRRFPAQPALAVPFAFAVFMSAGVAALPMSNPMNMVVADGADLSFMTYVGSMLPLAIVGWAISFVALRLVFARLLATPLPPLASTSHAATGRQRAVLALLLTAIVAYPVVGALGGPVWSVALGAALLAMTLVGRDPELAPTRLIHRGVSWSTLAFLLAVLVMALGLRDVGLVDRLAAVYEGAGVVTIGVTSALGSALLNNHPMALVNMLALDGEPAARVLAALVGGDLGPRLLPMGSLAGLLWIEQLRRQGVAIGLGTFVKVGLALTVPTLAASLAVLAW